MTYTKEDLTEALLICGDTTELLSDFGNESIDTICTDPPFFTNRTYELVWDKWGDDSEFKVIAEKYDIEEKHFNGKGELLAYNDRWKGGGGIDGLRFYLNEFFIPVSEELHRILKPTGSLFIHCDRRIAPYAKVELDKIFGYDNFINEIIWSYKSGGAGKHSFAHKHDNIFFYAKDKDKHFFIPQIERRSPEELPDYPHLDEKGHFKWWAKPGSRSGGENGKKIHFEKGTIMRDVWEIPIINQRSKDRIGYATQKPVELSKRMIEATTKIGCTVFDPFCGGGTTNFAAMDLNRMPIGIDVSPVAITLTRKRIEVIPVKVVGTEDESLLAHFDEFLNVDNYVARTKTWHHQAFEHWVAISLDGVWNSQWGADHGIDGTIIDGDIAIQAKQSKNGVSAEEFRDFRGALRLDQKGILVGYKFSRPLIEFMSKIKIEENDERVSFMTVEELIKMNTMHEYMEDVKVVQNPIFRCFKFKGNPADDILNED